MNLKEAGWRAIYERLVVLSLNEALTEALEEFPGAEEADHAVCYGYVDHESGLFLEVMAAARMTEEGMAVYPPHPGKRSTVGAAMVDEQEIYIFDDEDAGAHPEYAEKIAQARFLPVSEGVRRSRNMEFLDHLRDQIYVDDLRIYMIKDDMEPEVCWVRIEDLNREEHNLTGRLLGRPKHDFGVEAGDVITFYVQKLEDEKIICCADFDRPETIVKRRADEADPLRRALADFEHDKTYEGINRVIEALRERDVWLPCNTVLSQEEQAKLEALLDEYGEDVEKLNEYIMSSGEKIELVPDILKHEDGSMFLPVFVSPEDMGSYGDRYSKVEKPFLEVLDMVEHHQEDLVGVVINPFTDSMIIAKDLFQAVRHGLDVALSATLQQKPASDKLS